MEILNHYLVLFGAVSCSLPLSLAEGKMGQEQEAESKQNSDGLVWAMSVDIDVYVLAEV